MKPDVFSAIYDVLESVDEQNLLVLDSEVTPLIGDFCVNAMSAVCTVFLEAICGYDNPVNLNGTTLSALVSHEPGGTSLQNLNHWYQNVHNGSFVMFNYGSDEANI